MTRGSQIPSKNWLTFWQSPSNYYISVDPHLMEACFYYPTTQYKNYLSPTSSFDLLMKIVLQIYMSGHVWFVWMYVKWMCSTKGSPCQTILPGDPEVGQQGVLLTVSDIWHKHCFVCDLCWLSMRTHKMNCFLFTSSYYKTVIKLFIPSTCKY